MRTETTSVYRQINRLFHAGTVGGLTAPQLLEQFASGDEESAALAFEALVERHGRWSSGFAARSFRRILHEEIDRLPHPYRVAIVVCFLEGLSQAQAADQLRVPESTVRGRLARARRLLGQQLIRRGVAPSV